MRLAGRAGGLHDIVFKDGGAAEGAKDADGEDGNGDRSGNGEPGTQADVDGDRTEEKSEERAEYHGANGEFFWAFFGGYVGAEFTRRCRGTPWTFAQRILPFSGIECQCGLCGGIMPQVGEAGKRILASRGERDPGLLGLLTGGWHPCNVRRYKLLRSATEPMGRDPLRTRLTANPSRRPVTAERPSHMGVTCRSLPACRGILPDYQFRLGELS